MISYKALNTYLVNQREKFFIILLDCDVFEDINMDIR